MEEWEEMFYFYFWLVEMFCVDYREKNSESCGMEIYKMIYIVDY